MNHEIISSGSDGNAVVIEKSILIDCGVPFKALRHAYRDLQLVLLSHVHSDHFNRYTIKRLAKDRPTLRFGCGEWLAADLATLVPERNIDVYDMDKLYGYGSFTVQPFLLVHNAPNCGYIVRGPTWSVLYATDTNVLDVDAPGLDLYLIEANYTEEEIVERIRRKEERGEHAYEWGVLRNHLSREKAEAFLANALAMHSEFIFIHQHREKETEADDGTGGEEHGYGKSKER